MPLCGDAAGEGAGFDAAWDSGGEGVAFDSGVDVEAACVVVEELE